MTLTIAIPSKGRLKERSLEILKEAGFGIDLPENQRSYFGKLTGVPEVGEAEIAFLSASEIARELIAGRVHLGITGEDLCREAIADVDTYLEFVLPLQFGQANVVVAVPGSWIDVSSMADLADVTAEFRARHGRRLRIATKYWQLTQDHFREHGITLYRIVESLGATEGAPAAGSADIIVDITSTGATLDANDLKQLENGTVLQSQANLIASRTASWTDTEITVKNRVRHAIDTILREISA